MTKRERAAALQEADAAMAWDRDAQAYQRCAYAQLETAKQEVLKIQWLIAYLDRLSADDKVGLVIESPINHPSMAYGCRLRRGLDGRITASAARDFNRCVSDFRSQHVTEGLRRIEAGLVQAAAVVKRLFETQ